MVLNMTSDQDESPPLGPRMRDLIKPTDNTSPILHTPHNFDYLDGSSFHYQQIILTAPQLASAISGGQFISTTETVLDLRLKFDDPFTNTSLDMAMDLIDETPTPPRRRGRDTRAIDWNHLRPARVVLLERFMEVARRPAANQFPVRSSSLAVPANTSETPSPQANVDQSSATALNEQPLTTDTAENPTLSQEDVQTPVLPSTSQTPLNPWLDPAQFVGFQYSPEREPEPEMIHEQEAILQSFAPIRAQINILARINQWRGRARSYRVYSYHFEEHPGQTINNLENYVEVLAELNLRQRTGGIPLRRTEPRSGFQVVRRSEATEPHAAATQFQSSSGRSFPRLDVTTIAQERAPVAMLQANIAPSMIPEDAFEFYQSEAASALAERPPSDGAPDNELTIFSTEPWDLEWEDDEGQQAFSDTIVLGYTTRSAP